MQLSFGDAEHTGKRERTRKEIFLAEMEQVVPWNTLQALIAPNCPKMGRPGRQPYVLATMLRIHFLQQWYALSDPAMEEALCDTAVMRRFARLGALETIPDETTILNFRRLLETHDLAPKVLERVNAHLARKGQSLKAGTIVDATIIAAPSSTKNQDGERDPDRLLHGKEETVCGDSGYTGADKREELADVEAAFWIAEKPSKLRAMKNTRERKHAERWEHFKASHRAKVEHPFRVAKRKFGYMEVRYRGPAKNAAQVLTLFALSNLWMERRRLLQLAG